MVEIRTMSFREVGERRGSWNGFKEQERRRGSLQRILTKSSKPSSVPTISLSVFITM